MTVPSSPLAAGELPAQVKATREALLGLLRDLDPTAASWVDGTRKARAGKPSIVVVGETGRGKSSLVNALLAIPNLSPVDADGATAAYLVFDHADVWRAEACYPGHLPDVPIDPGELVRWVSGAHELPDGQLPPRHVRVSGPCPLLERVTVVDTPGVGGLDSMHGQLAAEAVAAATALLFVVDASAPLTSHELGFLRRVSGEVETVLFVLTKTDQFRGWRQVLEADQRLLAEHAPRFAGAVIHPVSARLFEKGAEAPTAQTAGLLRERSGIIELQVAVQRAVLGRTAMLGEANTLRALASALGEQHASLLAERRALSTGEREAEALRARRDELAVQRRSSSRGWQLTLRSEIQRARVDCAHEVGRQLREVQSWFRQQIDAANADRLGALPREVDAALRMTSGRLTALLGQRLNEVTAAALSELFSAEELQAIRAQFDRADGPQVLLRAPEARPPTAEDKLLVFMGVSGGIGVGKLAAMPLAGMALLNPLVLPATIVVGLGAGWWMARTRKHAAGKQHVKQWLTESIADARSTLDQLVAEQMIDAEQQLSLALDEALGKRIDAIDNEIKDVDKALKMDAQERSKKLAELTARITDVGEGLRKAEAFLAKIRGAGPKA